MSRELRAAWEAVCRDFFPRWDLDGAWRVKLHPVPHPCDGACDDARKTISLSFVPGDPDDRDLLLVHQICHAVTGRGHGKRWLGRMTAAAERAKALGREGLAEKLAGEVEDYEDGLRLTADEVYGWVQDAVIQQPHAAYESVRDWVAWECGLTSEEFEARFRRARKVYDQAQASAEQTAGAARDSRH